MVHISQGVRHCAEGCITLGWNLASVINDTIGATGSTPLYLSLPPIWGSVGSDLLDPPILPVVKDQVQGTYKKDSLPRRSLQEILHEGGQELKCTIKGH
jgi:hypothetical protein